jgi:hypothetical protein
MFDEHLCSDRNVFDLTMADPKGPRKNCAIQAVLGNEISQSWYPVYPVLNAVL